MILTTPSQYPKTLFIKDVTCCASSLVGTKINALIPCSPASVLVLVSDLASKTFWTAGTPYAAVLPLPVLAFARTSFPCRMSGMA